MHGQLRIHCQQNFDKDLSITKQHTFGCLICSYPGYLLAWSSVVPNLFIYFYFFLYLFFATLCSAKLEFKGFLPPFSLLRDFSFQNTSEHFAIRFRQSYLIWEVCDVTAIELSSKE